MINGSYTIIKNGNVVEKKDNIITNFGKDTIVKYLCGTVRDWGGAIAVGAGSSVIASPTATQATVGSSNIVVSSATGILAGQYIRGTGLAGGTKVGSGYTSGTTIPITIPTTAAMSSAQVYFYSDASASNTSLGFEFSRNSTLLKSPQTSITSSITNKALTSNVATLTTAYNHEFQIGDSVVIADVDATFNGTYTVTAVTTNTFSYAKTATNVTSVAITPYGSATLSARRITIKTSLSPVVSGTIYEVGVFSVPEETQKYGFDSKLISATNEGVDSTGLDTSKWYVSAARDTTYNYIGSSSILINNSTAVLGAGSNYATFPGILNKDFTQYSANDSIQLAFYVTNVTSISAKTLTLRFRDNQVAPKTMYYTYTFPATTPLGFQVLTVPFKNFTFDSGFNYSITSIEVTTNHTQNISIDGIRVLNSDFTNINSGLVSRAILSNPVVKNAGDTLDVEYVLSLVL